MSTPYFMPDVVIADINSAGGTAIMYAAKKRKVPPGVVVLLYPALLENPSVFVYWQGSHASAETEKFGVPIIGPPDVDN